ncbi:cobaltochelatase subunit CobN [Stomatohabitans albus]|uniref:cobaltochelatase subunit CobN n=1 Tax=Stomatohabitans albus TaxID=3110766 RepID=UPI00300C9E4C
MTTICYFSTTGGSLPLVSTVAHELQKNDEPVTVIARGIEQLTTPEAITAFAHACVDADITILCLHGGLGSFPGWPTLAALREARREAGQSVGWLHIQPTDGDQDATAAAMAHGDGIEERIWPKLSALLRQGGLDNIRHVFLTLLARVHGNELPIPDPMPMPFQGISHPQHGLFTNLADYLSVVGSDKPLIGIIYPRTFWIDRNTDIEYALVEAIEARGAIAVPIFCYRWADASYGGLAFSDVIDAFCRVDGTLRLDVMIDLFGMSMTMIDPGLSTVFADLDLPVLHAMTSYGTYAQWAQTAQGLGGMDVSTQAAGPEFDGEIIAAFVGTREIDLVDPLTGAMQPRRAPIPDRIAAMANQALAWARLRYKPNHEKKIAIIFHHNPPRDDKIGCAFGLDSFESIRRLLLALDHDGYDVGEPFAYGDEIIEAIRDGLTGDQRFLDAEQMHINAQIHGDVAAFQPMVDGLPQVVQTEMERNWGSFPGDLFVYHDQFSFPGVTRGNVYLTIQPPRGAFEAITDGRMHDDSLPPPHHYLAHYRYIRDHFGADAVIHVGTHGTLEWLPGKGLGLSESCYPELVLTHLPNIYPYIINNPGEGTQAKRRSAAVIIDHLTPPMRPSGLYDELAEIERIVRDYSQAVAVDTDRARAVARQLWDAVVRADLQVDLELTQAQAEADPDGIVDQVNHHLMHLSENVIADGLHVLGSVVADGGTTLQEHQPDTGTERARLATFLTQLTRIPNGDIPGLRDAILEAWGTSLSAAHHAGTQPIFKDGRIGSQVIEDAQQTAETLMDMVVAWAQNGRLEPEDAKTNACDITKAVLGFFDAQVCTVVHFVITELLWRLDHTKDEITATLNALAGRFVLAGPSGAPTRGNALILPTGRNFYSIDPLTMPTPAAWEEGVTLAEQLLANHAAAHPDDPYPHNVGLVVWGSANMRTGGTDIAEILYLYGLRPQWAASGHVQGLEIIPISELGRPRIDATPRVSGFFRDAFPNLVDLIDKAARMVAALEEPEEQNRLRAHVLEDVKLLTARGLSVDDAMRSATLRVFGCQPGNYGVGIEALIETGQWETQADLAETFIADSAYAYGEGVFGQADTERYERRLATMDVVTKNEDTREYDMLSCTDFYNEFGGLIAATTHVRGVKPDAYVGDMADPRRIQTRTGTEEARLIIRSRVLNPAWITGLQRHGYKGAGDLSKVLDILIGWDALADVVDDTLWRQVAERYAFDPNMQAFFTEHNPHALYNITNKLIDAAERGIWSAPQDAIDRLNDIRDAVEGDIEALMDDDAPSSTPLSSSGGIDLRTLGLSRE